MDFNKCEIQRMLLQLQSGHCRLREHMHKIRASDDPFCECNEPELVDHYQLYCENYTRERETMYVYLPIHLYRHQTYRGDRDSAAYHHPK